LSEKDYDVGDDKSLCAGHQLVIKSCKAPFTQINRNAGHNSKEIERRLKNKQKRDNFDGFNTLTGKYVNMYDAGIIDPTKVERCALENAVSVTGLLLTTDTLIINNEDV